MRRNRHRLRIPQHEFSFTPGTFNLIVENATDGDRIARERTEADEARRTAEAAQAALFSTTQRRDLRTPKRTPKELKTVWPS
jgi:hypothetical protein